MSSSPKSAASLPEPLACEYSTATWKHAPSTWEVFFGLKLPYRPPSSLLGAYFWRKRLWFETTFALSMMQPWEKIMLVLALMLLSSFFSTALWFYFPTHLAIIISRAKYYLSGDLPSILASDSRGASYEESHGYVLGVLGDYSKYAYECVVGGIQRLVNTWGIPRWMINGTGLSAEL